MGERGPIPKPRDKAVGHRQHLVLATAATAPEAPPAPKDLTPQARKAWKVYWNSAVATVTDPVDMPAIRRLFELYSQHEKAGEVVKQALVVKGSVGQIRVNPLADHMLKLETAILRLENELGLTPSARARLGVEVGAALKTIDDLNRLTEIADDGDDFAGITTLVEPGAPVADQG